MSRRFNFTGRRKLMRSNVRILIHEAKRGIPQSFTADVKIPAVLKLDPSARVYVEAYIGASSMRFDFGTVAAVVHPRDCSLGEIDEGAPVLFRVRVVDETRNVGRVLAAANGIRPEGEEAGSGRRSLLPLRSCDLGEEVWRLHLDSDAGPELWINSRVPALSERLRSDPAVMGLIYPEVVRRIAYRLWSNSEFADDADWVAAWKTWLGGYLDRPVDAEEIEEDADEMAKNFAAKHRFASGLVGQSGEELA